MSTNIGMARVLLTPDMHVCDKNPVNMQRHTNPFSTNTEPVPFWFLELQTKCNESYSTARRAAVDDTFSIRTVRLKTCGNRRRVHRMAPRFREARTRLVQESELIRWNRRRRTPHQPGSAWTEDLSAVRRKRHHPPASDREDIKSHVVMLRVTGVSDGENNCCDDSYLDSLTS